MVKVVHQLNLTIIRHLIASVQCAGQTTWRARQRTPWAAPSHSSTSRDCPCLWRCLSYLSLVGNTPDHLGDIGIVVFSSFRSLACGRVTMHKHLVKRKLGSFAWYLMFAF